MALMSYLPINLTAGFPQRFSCRINGRLLIFTVYYNSEGDFYAATVYDQYEEAIVYNKPFIYGTNLFDGVEDARLPDVPIVTADLAGTRLTAGRENFMVDVFPWIMG